MYSEFLCDAPSTDFHLANEGRAALTSTVFNVVGIMGKLRLYIVYMFIKNSVALTERLLANLR